MVTTGDILDFAQNGLDFAGNAHVVLLHVLHLLDESLALGESEVN